MVEWLVSAMGRNRKLLAGKGENIQLGVVIGT